MADHDCIQQENIGSLKEAVISLKDAVLRLDKRCNGTFESIGDHIKESPVYRGKIDILENEIKNIKEEKNNTTKASQWRIALIVGSLISIINLLANIFLK